MYKTRYHAKYLAHRLMLKESETDHRRIGQTFYDSTIQLNPHQVEAAIFAFKSPSNKGVILADEVGLGKTIEAGLIISQYWSEMKRKILIITPPALMKQWEAELEEKFSLKATIMDSALFNKEAKKNPNPLNVEGKIFIISYHFAKSKENFIKRAKFDVAIMDEAHKLRNITETSESIKRSLKSTRKVLLTATPIQNSINDLYNLCSFIETDALGGKDCFDFLCKNNLEFAKESLGEFVHRTLRQQVADYIKYPKRYVKTFNFVPTPQEQKVYNLVMEYLQDEDLPSFQRKGVRGLLATIIRKQLASSTPALISTLRKTEARLWALYQNTPTNPGDIDWKDELDELEADYEETIQEFLSEPKAVINKESIQKEIRIVQNILSEANKIPVDSKALKLIETLGVVFKQLQETKGANQKVLIFTECRKTQDYLFELLKTHGYQKIVRFSGDNKHEEQQEIYQRWKAKSEIKESKTVAIRKALIEEFKNHAEIMIVTEAGSEGLNLQFCSAVINYDLPWNPQRIEQRIGRCHRYGQKVDVVVFNFINTSNQVEQRTYALLDEKFKVFEGLFGASDAVLGLLDQGNDLEKKLMKILLNCRNQEEVDYEFELLQKQYSKEISAKLKETQRKLIEHFDEEVSNRFHKSEEEMKIQLGRIEDDFWNLTKIVLHEEALFDDEKHQFLLSGELEDVSKGLYQLILRSNNGICDPDAIAYKISSPLGQHVIQTPLRDRNNREYVEFDLTNYPNNISGLNQYKNRECYLNLTKLKTTGIVTKERLILTGITSEGEVISQELLEKLFRLDGKIKESDPFKGNLIDILEKESNKKLNDTVTLLNLENDKACKEAYQKIHKEADLQFKAIENRIELLKQRRDELSYLIQSENSNWQDIERYNEEQRQVIKQLKEARQAQTDEEDEVDKRTRKRIKQFQKALRYEQESVFTIKFKII